MKSISKNQEVWMSRDDIWKPSALLAICNRNTEIKDKDLKFFCQNVVEVVCYSLRRGGLSIFRYKGSLYLCNSTDNNYYINPDCLRLRLEDVAITLGLDRIKARSLYFSDKLLSQFTKGTEIMKLIPKGDNPDFDRLVSDLERKDKNI